MTWLNELSSVHVEWNLEEVKRPDQVSKSPLSQDFSVLEITLNWFRADSKEQWWNMTDRIGFLLEALYELNQCQRTGPMVKVGEGGICSDSPPGEWKKSYLRFFDNC